MSDIDFSTTVDAPIFERDAKGKIPTTASNLLTAISRPEICGYRFTHGTRPRDVLLTPLGGGDSRLCTPLTLVGVRLKLENFGFRSTSRCGLMRMIRYFVNRGANI
jgi:hypothetical protein